MVDFGHAEIFMIYDSIGMSRVDGQGDGYAMR